MSVATTTQPVSAEMPRSVLNRSLYSDGFNADCFVACLVPTGVAVGALRQMARNAGTALAMRFEPIAKHSRATGKRGYRWDVLIDGKHANANGAVSLATINALKPESRITIRNVRATDGVYIDSHGVTKTAERVAALADDSTAPVVPAPEPPKPETKPVKPASKSPAKKSTKK